MHLSINVGDELLIPEVDINVIGSSEGEKIEILCDSKYDTVWYVGNIAKGRDEDLIPVNEMPQEFVNANIYSRSEHSVKNMLWLNLRSEYSGYYSCVHSNNEHYMDLYDMTFIDILADSTDTYRISRGNEAFLNFRRKPYFN